QSSRVYYRSTKSNPHVLSSQQYNSAKAATCMPTFQVRWSSLAVSMKASSEATRAASRRSRSGSAGLCPASRYIPVSPLVLIDPIFVDVEPVRGVREAGQTAQACHGLLRLRARGVHADELDILGGVFPRMDVLQHENACHRRPPARNSNARSPHFLILLNSLPGPVG